LLNNLEFGWKFSCNFFGINKGVVGSDFKNATAGGDHLTLHWQYGFNFFRQTGGARAITSGIAIFDTDLHVVLL
jgi:hypothetical protein